jgi:hypothetical protein
MAFGVADDDGNITTNGIVTGTLTLLMSLLLLGCAFKVCIIMVKHCQLSITTLCAQQTQSHNCDLFLLLLLF